MTPEDELKLWRMVVMCLLGGGQYESEHTTIIGIRRGVLRIEVADDAFRSLINSRSEVILEQFQKLCGPQISGIIFLPAAKSSK